jgi:flagellar basal-body rod modification protein FlgD
MITNVSTTTDATASTDAMKQSTGLSKDDFLKLFIAQLENQDPLDPQDSSEFTAQLAQLTQVEQAYSTNSNLEKLLAAQNNSASLSSVSFIGKSVVANGNSIDFDGSSSATLKFNLASAAESVTITISDSLGKIVCSGEVGSLSSGDNAFTWDGKDSSGSALSAGAYTFAVAAAASDGSEITVKTYTTGVVDSVSLANDTPALAIGSVSVALTDLVNIGSI